MLQKNQHFSEQSKSFLNLDMVFFNAFILECVVVQPLDNMLHAESWLVVLRKCHALILLVLSNFSAVFPNRHGMAGLTADHYGYIVTNKVLFESPSEYVVRKVPSDGIL